MRTIDPNIIAKFEQEELFTHLLFKFEKEGVFYRYTDADVPIVIPEEVLSGTELIKDGGFEHFSGNFVKNFEFFDSLDYWTGNHGTLAIVAGGLNGNCLQLTRVDDNYQQAIQTLTLEVGKTYYFSAWVKSGTSGNETVYLQAADSSGLLDYGETTTSGSWVEVTVKFVPKFPTVVIYLTKVSATPGTMLFDRVTVHEIPPEGVAWTVYEPENSDTISIVKDREVKRNGSASCRLDVNGTGEFYIRQIVTLEPNKKYRLSFWHKEKTVVAAGRLFDFRATGGTKFLKEDGTWADAIYFPPVTHSTEWTFYYIDFIVPAGYSEFYLFPFAGSAIQGVGNQVWFEDFSIQEISENPNTNLPGRYEPWGLQFNGVQYSSTNIVDSVRISIDAINQVLHQIFGSGNVQGEEATLGIIVLNDDAPQVDSKSAMLGIATLFMGEIDEWEFDEARLDITLTSVMYSWAQSSLNIHSPSCRWKEFKDEDCQYAGSETTCDRSYARCESLANTINFGGCRWIPGIQEIELWWGAFPYRSPSSALGHWNYLT